MAPLDKDILLLLHAQQSSENAVILFDREGVIVWCNDTCNRLFGYKSEELLGRSLHRLFTPEDIQQGIPDYELNVAANSAADMNNDRWMLRSNGSRFWATGNTTGLRNSSDQVIGFGKILRDSTDIKVQIEALRNRVNELSAADEHKNLFLAKLSHELRTPLGALTNALQIISKGRALDADLRYPINLIERQAEFIQRLVDDLLDVTRINMGKVQLELHPLDIREIVARAVENVRPLIEERGQTLIEHILAIPMMVNADAVRLEQVFVNLLANATKYTPSGGKIEVRASVGHSEVWVRVADNGIGIPAETLPHVFELFTRGETASTQVKDGLGIGLSLVREFVNLHGGSTQVRSDGPDKGSEFTVRLPLASKHTANEERRAPATTPKATNISHLNRSGPQSSNTRSPPSGKNGTRPGTAQLPERESAATGTTPDEMRPLRPENGQRGEFVQGE